jgi:hypothetical protein
LLHLREKATAGATEVGSRTVICESKVGSSSKIIQEKSSRKNLSAICLTVTFKVIVVQLSKHH